MQTNVSIAALCAVSSFYVSHVNAADQIERITVTANKFEQSIENTLATVNLISRQEIESSNARDLPELLQSIAGVDLVRSGGLGQKTSVFVRGALSKHLLVLVDGVRVSDANSGDAPFALIPLNMIERIELVKGPRAAIYGSDAIAGVLNLITRKANQQQVSVSAGSHSYGNLEAAFTASRDALRVNLNLGVESTGGYDVTQKDSVLSEGKDHDRDGYLNRNIGTSAHLDLDNWGQFVLRGQYAEGSADYDNAWGNDHFDFANYQAQLGWQLMNDDIEYDVQFSRSRDKSEQLGGFEAVQYETLRDALDARLRYRVTNTLSVHSGINWLEEDVSGSSATLNRTRRDNTALFIGAFYDNRKWLANATLRSDDYSQHGRQNTYQGALGYRPHKAITLRLSAGSAFRAPLLTDLYVENNPWVLANPNLDPEKARNTELGVNIKTDRIEWDVALFSNRIDNLIGSDYDLESGKFTTVNIDAARMEGLELSGRFDAMGLHHQLALTLLDATDETTGSDLVRRPSRSLNWEIAKQWDKLDLSLNLIYRSARPSIAYFDTRIGGYTIINLSANYQLVDGLTLTARIDNLTDKDYITGGLELASDGSLLGYQAPPRQLFVGARYHF